MSYTNFLNQLDKIINSFEVWFEVDDPIKHSLFKEIDETGNDDIAAIIYDLIVKVNHDILPELKEIKKRIENSLNNTDINNAIDLESIASLANELDASGDPDFVRKASVLDTVLTLFANKNLEKIADEELNKLKQRYKDRDFENNYKEPAKQIAKYNGVEGRGEAFEKAFQSKTYRPLEQALSTRSCPDHPGNSLMRVGEDTYQCSLDRKIYDFTQGFMLNSGNKLPGSSVQNQNRSIYENMNANQVFDTREQRTKNK